MLHILYNIGIIRHDLLQDDDMIMVPLGLDNNQGHVDIGDQDGVGIRNLITQNHFQ